MQCWDGAPRVRSMEGSISIRMLVAVHTNLSVMRTHRHGRFDLLINNDMDLDSLLGLFKEKSIQTPFRK